MGMDAYILKYEYEFPGKPENVDKDGKIDSNKVKWEFKYSELGTKDYVMTASFKKQGGGIFGWFIAGGLILWIIFPTVVVILLIVIIVLIIKKKKTATEPPAA
jgi:hypothetical protein